jgi:5-methylcytosine-specific restriction protein B
MEEEYGAGFSFYQDGLPDIWRTPSTTKTHAWLIRGATDRGINRIADWLERGYASIGWEDSLGLRPGMTIPELADAIRTARPDFKPPNVRMGAGNMERFFDRMAVGDLAVTLDGDRIYLGRVTGDPAKRGTGGEGAVWHRDVSWLNPTEPFMRSDLAADLQTALRTRMTLTDLSKHRSALDALLGETEQWDEFVHWAARIYETPGFDAEERDYKLEIGERLAAAREALEASGDWVGQLRRAFGGNNNLTSWRAHNTFIKWCETNPEAGAAYLRSAWSGEPDDVELRALFDTWPIDESPGDRVSIVAFLFGAVDPHRFPVYRAEPVGRARKLVGLELVEGRETEDLARRYEEFLKLLDELSDRLAQRGTEIRDRLDAQGLVWWLTRNPPPESWEEDEREAFLDWRGDKNSNGTDRMALIPPVAEALAESLFVTRAWLAEIVELLNEKQQVVFYGPPGTGKTFVAQALARHVEELGGESELVQFHPAYSYEDFFEGYRPKLDGARGVEYELRAGPLLRIADAARANPERPHLLIIDEINRGNIAKIFGELYFLLEYRERGIKLQYSPEVNFSLPENLYVIGTMNTADRSIALVDSALRRRFYFVPFLPNEEPLRGVLRRWLSHQGYDLEAADYLERLNVVLAQSGGDDEFAIGASYFMTRDGAPDIERVWRYAIAPLLEERFYGARRLADIQRQFSPDGIHAPSADSES